MDYIPRDVVYFLIDVHCLAIPSIYIRTVQFLIIVLALTLVTSYILSSNIQNSFLNILKLSIILQLLTEFIRNNQTNQLTLILHIFISPFQFRLAFFTWMFHKIADLINRFTNIFYFTVLPVQISIPNHLFFQTYEIAAIPALTKLSTCFFNQPAFQIIQLLEERCSDLQIWSS